ncbi:hypothetical protein, partial [Idiomarina sp.]|uniref:hypothetical protein n=1 Tax=Idiomarina sp. TaxID=1874361 RepID=UPI00258E2BE9
SLRLPQAVRMCASRHAAVYERGPAFILLLHSLAVRSTGKQGLAQAQRAPSQPAGAARIQAQSLLDVIKQAQLIDTRKHLL